MAQLVKARDDKSKDLNSGHRTHVVEEEKQVLQAGF